MAVYKRALKSTVAYIDWLWQHEGLTALLDEAIYSDTEAAEHQCNLCGNKFLAIPTVLKRWIQTGDNGCRLCFPKVGGSIAWTQAHYEAELLAKVGSAITLVGQYKTQNTKTAHLCTVCLHEWFPCPGLVLAGYGCPKCSLRRAASNAVRRKSVVLDGKRFDGLQGYEPAALRWMTHNKNLSVTEIEPSSNAPVVDYVDADGKHRRHLPDFYIPGKNLLVEVKSDYTFRKALARNQQKCKFARSQGFRYVMLVLDRSGERLTLPKNWQNMKKTELIRRVPWLN